MEAVPLSESEREVKERSSSAGGKDPGEAFDGRVAHANCLRKP